jgi:hypothetical protein
MAREVDEDLIEATIRRVQAAQAGHDRSADEADAAPAHAVAARPVHAPDEDTNREAGSPAEQASTDDLIEATIRRVAAMKAAREKAAAEEPASPSSIATPAPAFDEGEPAGDEPGAPDEAGTNDLIEATIRRVAAMKAARDAEEARSQPALHIVGADEGEDLPSDIEPLSDEKPESPDEPPAQEEPPAFVETEDIDVEPEPATEAQQDLPLGQTTATIIDDERASRIEARAEGVERTLGETTRRLDGMEHTLEETGRRVDGIERTLDETVRRLDDLSGRLAAALPLLERAAAAAVSSARAPRADDDGWREEPQPPQPARPPISLNLPPRPQIFRDPSPQTATAEHLAEAPEADVIDTRPLPKPLPPLEPRRALDLLPRAYRITVEDKRRGVDLVPLHRALLSMEGVRDMSLLSYSNGVAIVSLEMNGPMDADALAAQVGRAMSRSARVESHNESTLVVKLED